MGNLPSQFLWCDTPTFRRCSSTVLKYHSSMPSDCGCSAVVRVLLIPRRYRRDSEVMALVTMYIPRHSEASEEVRHRQRLLIGYGVGFQSLGKRVHSDQEVSISLSLDVKGRNTSTTILSNGPPTLY
jgi:hypothetical protein